MREELLCSAPSETTTTIQDMTPDYIAATRTSAKKKTRTSRRGRTFKETEAAAAVEEKVKQNVTKL